MWNCIQCHTQNSDENNFCVKCGLSKPGPNHCTNEECENFELILKDPEQKYCGKCGHKTTYWEEAQNYS